jgi:integrase
VNHLRKRDNGRDGKLSEGSVRKYLNSFSNLFARAGSDEHVARNPVADMYTKPTEERREAKYLEAHEAALLLESARTYRAPVDDGGFPWMYPLLATLLLTGGRRSEVFGLELDDVSLTHGKILPAERMATDEDTWLGALGPPLAAARRDPACLSHRA